MPRKKRTMAAVEEADDSPMKDLKKKARNAPKQISKYSDLVVGNNDTELYGCEVDEKMPLAVDYRTLKRMHLPPDWGEPYVAKLASSNNEHLARLMGHITLKFKNVSLQNMKRLIKENIVEETYVRNTEPKQSYLFDQDGEFSTSRGVIRLTGLLDEIERVDVPNNMDYGISQDEESLDK
eukprot:gene10757-22476_t